MLNCISEGIKKAIYLYIRCMAFLWRDKTAKALSVFGLPRGYKEPLAMTKVEFLGLQKCS
jgi:hypothetical protein